MLTEHFTAILDFFAEWKIGVEKSKTASGKVCGRPPKDDLDNELNNPIRGFPVVLSYKTIAHPCDWCNEVCFKEKVYKRSIGSNVWQAKCQDCGGKRNFLTGEINSDK